MHSHNHPQMRERNITALPLMHAVADHLQKTDQKSAGDTHITRINFMHILKLLQMNLDDETEIHATK